MSDTPLTPQERADLVAFLDGELTGEAARAIEAKLALNPTARAEAESLKRTWEMLDFLPRSEPSPSFTQRTLSKLTPLPPQPEPAGPRRRWPRLLLAAGWAAVLALATWGGYAAYGRLVPREPGEAELVRDLRLIENKRFYDLVDDMDFLNALDHPDLFGEEATP